MPETPSLNDWLKNNPGRGINDYYREFPAERASPKGQPPFRNTREEKPAGPLFSRSSQPDVALILFSFMLIVSFFLPWVDFNLPDVQAGPFSLDELLNYRKLNGYELPERIGSIISGFPLLGLWSIYLVPLSAFLVIMAEMAELSLARVSGEVILVIIILYWITVLNRIFLSAEMAVGIEINPYQFYSFGLLLTLFGAIYYLFDLGRALFMDR